jgi:ketol-acid reductoisomerase
MNFFNSLPLRLQLEELGKCNLLSPTEFNGVDKLKGKKIVIIGCGAQGLNQGLNLRDSGLDVSYALRAGAISEKRQSWKNATENGFTVETFDKLVPTADLVINLTPDKQHSNAVSEVMPLMKEGSCLSYSHGFNIVEEGMKIRDDITVIMVAPKSPGTEVREEYKRGFGVPTLIAVHGDNDPKGDGVEIAKAYAVGTGGHRAGVLMSSFVAEVKSDLMGEQTILCGMLQTGSILCYDKMIEKGVESGYASKLVQQGWETITEALKVGGNTNMLNRLSNPAKIKAFQLTEELKEIMRPLYENHMDRIITGEFSTGMMEDWDNGDADLLKWREETNSLAFEVSTPTTDEIDEQAFFDNGILMIAMIKAGVELAFEAMTAAGMKEESAYYESLHEVPLIANLIARKKLYEMNRVISDTAEYGCYLFSQKCAPLLADFMGKMDTDVIGKGLASKSNGVDNKQLDSINHKIQNHPVEKIGVMLREYMNKNRD